jgi:hypothetical protein
MEIRTSSFTAFLQDEAWQENRKIKMFHEVVLILKNTKNSYVSLFFVEV